MNNSNNNNKNIYEVLILISFILTTTLWDMYYHLSHFVNEESLV